MFWNRQRGRVYVYVFQNGKQRALPRETVRHLDGEPDHNVWAWVAQHQEQFEGKKYTLEHFENDRKLSHLVELFVEYLKSRKLTKPTVQMHRYRLTNYALRFFVAEHGLSDPNTWPAKSRLFLAYMQKLGRSSNYILKANTSLRMFWRWLAEERYLTSDAALFLRNPVADNVTTPLKFTLTPQEVLAYAAGQTNPELAFLALVGFFFSLRPFEAFGLRRSDFRAGSAAANYECSKVMAKYGLYSRFVVSITRQRRPDGSFFTPKADSRGIVACFDKEAARMLVRIITDMPVRDDAPLLKFLNDWYIVLWGREGIPGVTLKDLRRASLYWLGHHTEFDLVPLKNHARHKRAETTILYVRRPEEELDDFTKLDLET